MRQEPDPGVDKIRQSVAVSGPLGVRAGVLASVAGSAAAAATDSQLVFVSMPSGTFIDADSASIVLSAGSSAPAREAMIDGGFDPVALYARPDDSLDVAISTRGHVTTARMRVPAFRQPSVVRTTPAAGRTDVPLNQEIIIVFTQPIDGNTVTPSSVQLLVNGVAVPATVQVQASAPWVVHLTPSATLSPNSAYTLVVATSVTDVNGSALVATSNAEFTTGLASSAIASIAVRTQVTWSGYNANPSGEVDAIPGASVQFEAYKISASGDALNPGYGDDIVWSSSATAVATVDSHGVASTVAPGEATIIACAATVCGSQLIVVRDADAGVQPRELGDLGGGVSSVIGMGGAFVVGKSMNASQLDHAFLWSASRGMEDLGLLPGAHESAALFVNASGTVVGWSDAGNWIWSRTKGLSPLPNPDAAHPVWYPQGITASGDVVFQTEVLNSTGTIGVWSPTKGPRVILPGVPFAYVQSMNNVGHILLGTLSSDGNNCGSAAYIWDLAAGRVTMSFSVTDVPGEQATILCPVSINDEDDVGGIAYTDVSSRAFRWSVAKGLTFFPGSGSAGGPLNESGDEVLSTYLSHGSGTDFVTVYSAKLWKANGDVIDLASLGGNSTLPSAVNDANLVAGTAQSGSSSGPFRAVVWDITGAVPSARKVLARGVAPAGVRTVNRIGARKFELPRGLLDAAGLHRSPTVSP